MNRMFITFVLKPFDDVPFGDLLVSAAAATGAGAGAGAAGACCPGFQNDMSETVRSTLTEDGRVDRATQLWLDRSFQIWWLLAGW